MTHEFDRTVSRPTLEGCDLTIKGQVHTMTWREIIDLSSDITAFCKYAMDILSDKIPDKPD